MRSEHKTPAYLRQRAERCREVARTADNPDLAKALIKLADDFEAAARREAHRPAPRTATAS